MSEPLRAIETNDGNIVSDADAKDWKALRDDYKRIAEEREKTANPLKQVNSYGKRSLS